MASNRYTNCGIPVQPVPPIPLPVPEGPCSCALEFALLLDALGLILDCVCTESVVLPVTDSGYLVKPGSSDLSVTYLLPQGCRDISIYNGTLDIARASFSTGFCYVPMNGTQVLTNTHVEPSLVPFEGGSYVITFDRSPGVDAFVVINFRIF